MRQLHSILISKVDYGLLCEFIFHQKVVVEAKGKRSIRRLILRWRQLPSPPTFPSQFVKVLANISSFLRNNKEEERRHLSKTRAQKIEEKRIKSKVFKEPRSHVVCGGGWSIYYANINCQLDKSHCITHTHTHSESNFHVINLKTF